jgi:hypothetical protein
MYSWAWITTSETPETGLCSVLIRRDDTTGELAYYRSYSPTPVPLGDLVRVAGQRWTVEESFQTSKGLTGLDQHQVRTWTSWHRWSILVMLAHAFLAAQNRYSTRHRTHQPHTDLIEYQGVSQTARRSDPNPDASPRPRPRLVTVPGSIRHPSGCMYSRNHVCYDCTCRRRAPREGHR